MAKMYYVDRDENNVLLGVSELPIVDAQGKEKPGQVPLPEDHPDVVACLSPPLPFIPNWKAHAILKLWGKHDAVLKVVAAIPDPTLRAMVSEALDRLDPIPRNSPVLETLLGKVGLSSADIDRMFAEGNAIQIDP